MAHRVRQRANMAAWALNSAVLQSEFEAFDAGVAASIDGDAGGLWSPAAPIVVGGAGLDMLGPIRALGASGFNAAMQAQNWPERASVTVSTLLNFLTPICWDGANYVAQGNGGTSANSPDGLVWTGRSGSGVNTPSDLAAGVVGGVPGILMTDSSGLFIFKSLDGGATWSSSGLIQTITTSNALVYAASLGLWVVAGPGGINTSTDGSTWVNRTVPGGWAGKTPKRVVWNGALFVVIPLTGYNKLLTSPDGVTWTERTIGATSTWNGLAWSAYDSMWMIVGNTGLVYCSADGITWVAATPAFGFNDIANHLSLWVGTTGLGAGGGVVWSVDKGNTWHSKAVGLHAVITGGYSRIIAADSRFVMARSSATALDFALSLASS